MWLFPQLAIADVGETYELKKKRNQLLAEIAQVQNHSDSVLNWQALHTLQLEIIKLDEAIFASYDQTVTRIHGANIARTTNLKHIVYIALIAVAVALFFAALLWVARKRVLQQESVGLWATYTQLTNDWIKSVAPLREVSQARLRVNIVVIAGLVFMAASVVAYLVSQL